MLHKNTQVCFSEVLLLFNNFINFWRVSCVVFWSYVPHPQDLPTYQVQYVLPNYSWDWGVFWVSGGPNRGKPHSSSLSSCKMPITPQSWSGVGTSYLPSTCWDFIWLELAQRLWDWCYNSCEFVHVTTVWCWNTLFLCGHLWLAQTSHPLFLKDHARRSGIYTSHLRLRTHNFSFSATWPVVGLWWRLRDTLVF